MVRVVGDEDHGNPALASGKDVLEHDARLANTESRCWFVENQDVGTEVHGTSNRNCLTLTTRKGSDRLVGVAEVDTHVEQLGLGD